MKSQNLTKGRVKEKKKHIKLHEQQRKTSLRLHIHAMPNALATQTTKVLLHNRAYQQQRQQKPPPPSPPEKKL